MAVDTCTKRMPDAILIGWNLPAMMGIDFLRYLCGMTDGDAPVLVFCTTKNDSAYIETALSTVAGEFIIKPFDSEIVQLKHSAVVLI